MGNSRQVYIVLIIAILSLTFLNHFLAPTNSQEYDEPWWNSSWHYRIKITINTSQHERTDWPVELQMNFTRLLADVGVAGTFDENSTRVIEINDTGGILYEMKSQFDKALDYDSQDNAAGEVIFLLNGTVTAGTVRYFYIYYDIEENGKKLYPNYQSGLNITWDGEEAIINTTNFIYYIDTIRGQNTSGIYRLEYWQEISQSYQNIFTPSGAGERTREFIELTNGSDNFTYDLRYNGTIIEGPVRITFRQEGDEVYWNNPEEKTGKTHLLKEYRFYYNQNHSWIVTNISNIDSAEVYRNSTNSSAVAFDTKNAFGGDWNIYINATEPSWVRGSQLGTAPGVGLLNYNQTGTSNFNATTSDSSFGRIGINLRNTTIPVNSFITHTAAWIVNQSQNLAEYWEFYKDLLFDTINITYDQPERYIVEVDTEANFNNVTWAVSTFNRNESIIITANITFDPWNISDHVNLTLDNGTATSADDIIIMLYDDGTHGDGQAGDYVFTNYYNLTNASQTGPWNLTTLVFDADGYAVNTTNITIEVTNIYNVSTEVDQPTGLGGRNVTATVRVMNYRKDSWISGATLNCTAAGEQVDPGTNISDYGNGTYLVWFDAPSDYGTYILNCTAEKDGNKGYDKDEFTVESATTEVMVNHSITLYTAENVAFYQNESFELYINLTNIGNSSAYDANFSLKLSPELAANRTFVDCGDIYIGYSCAASFNITVLNNTAPGYYYVNTTAWWMNFVGSDGFNQTNTTINVTENPVLYVNETEIEKPVPPGNESTVYDLEVFSIGNVPLDNVNFSVTGYNSNFTFKFTPASISSLTNGQSSVVEINVTIDQYTSPGIYNGTINVTTDNDGYQEIGLSLIVTGTNLSIEKQPEEYTANYVTRYTSEDFDVFVNVSNTGNTTAYYSNITITLPSGWQSNTSYINCSNMSKGSNCEGTFNVTISNLTQSGYYDINFTVKWENIGRGWMYNTTTVNVTVVSNVTMEIAEKSITDTVQHNTVNRTIGNFTIRSTGNDKIINITFNLTGFDDFNVLYNTTSGFNLSAGSDVTTTVNVTIPAGYAPGTYNATLNITTNNTGSHIINLSVTVPLNASWYINQTYCERAQQPITGIVCEVDIENTGNINLTFNVTPGSNDYANHSNYTWLDSVNFTIFDQDSRTLVAYYNVTGVQGNDDFRQNYTINATHPSAVPGEVNLTLVLSRYIQAEVTIHTTTTKIYQMESLYIGAEVNSISGATIDQVIANVTRPDGSYSTYDMNYYGGSNPISYWDYDSLTGTPLLAYPGNWGNTSQRGNYTLAITAYDSQGVNSTENLTIEVYPKFMTTVRIPTIQQGELHSFYYRAHDYNMEGFPDIFVNVTIWDPDGNELYILSGNEYQTDSQGRVTQNLFYIPYREYSNYSYMFYANASYYYETSNVWIYNETFYKFEVKTEEDLKAKVDMPYTVYRDYPMPITVLVYNDTSPTDPDNFYVDLYLYTGLPNPTLWKTIYMSSFIRNSEGVYTYSENVGSTQTTGTYLAKVNVTKDNVQSLDITSFRISSGGPYDVGFITLDKEVSPGNFINFEFFVENKGEVDNEDVLIEYWISDQTQTWDLESFSTNILSGENKTFEEDLYIYNTQPKGNYTLNLRVVYDPTKPAATANATFNVVGAAPAGPAAPTGPGGGAAPPPGAFRKVKIIDFPVEISGVIGIPKFIDLQIKALDNVSDVRPVFSGSFADWFTSDPVKIESMGKNDTRIITLKLLIPPGTETGEYKGKVSIASNESETEDESPFVILVFTSRKELIEYELAKLKGNIKELEFRMKQARKEKSLTAVEKALEETNSLIKEAEGYLEEERYDSALTSVYRAWEQFRIAEDLFNRAPPLGFLEGVPMWLILIIILLVVVVALLIFFLRRTALDIRTIVGTRMSEARGIAKVARGTAERERLRAERDKAQRVLALLESQYRSGILSAEAYNTLRIRNEQKIRELDEKIRNTY